MAGPVPFADRLGRLVADRCSQLCLGLDPDPAALVAGSERAAEALGPDATAVERAGAAVAEHCRLLIAGAGSACVAVKPQLACFERLGAPGRRALELARDAAREAGLLVIADAKRADVPVSAAAYAQGLIGETSSPWGVLPGLGADAVTVNPLLGADSLEPWIAAAEVAGAGMFVLVRTSNPGAADVLDLPAPERPLFESLAASVAASAARLAGSGGLSGLGAVVGATRPEHLRRLRELMPASIFLLPGVGAQGGQAEQLGAAFSPGPASGLITASRSIAAAADPAREAERLRASAWDIASS